MATPYAIIWAKCRDTGLIIEDKCQNDADVSDWISDYDYEIVKLKYTNEVENV